MKKVCLSFDFEECDLPREGGVDFPLARGMAVSREGAHAVLDVLAQAGVRATFFCTLNFAENAPDVMARLLAEGHEVAAHGVDHFRPEAGDAERCKAGLKRLCGVDAVGYRQPRMFPTDDAALARAGFLYNSSLNPAFVPGRYLHLATPRTPFRKDGLVQIPASVTPFVRFPLFWLSLHLLPEGLYRRLALWTLRHDGHFVTYFHPWEFSPSFAAEAKALRVSPLIRRNLGAPMAGRLARLVKALRGEGAAFAPIRELAGVEDPRRAFEAKKGAKE